MCNCQGKKNSRFISLAFIELRLRNSSLLCICMKVIRYFTLIIQQINLIAIGSCAHYELEFNLVLAAGKAHLVELDLKKSFCPPNGYSLGSSQ